ncbi:MAG: TIGR01459 family HAD-type hydrolase [Alphaproteobacteria bacterium]|jgi:HAD superfamily hydrolase (TIGR01459 family)|nr:TIGR01459 family HAD-type hydrolase [Alphaproteobacteria bacterium]
MPKPTMIAGLAGLADLYDGFILDQWGVLHDGRAVAPEVRACLERLQAAGKPVVILSNSGRRAASNEDRLADYGVDRGLYRGLVSSGEVVWQSLKSGHQPLLRRLGRSCLLLSRRGDRSVIAGLDIAEAERAEQADFVLLSGCDAPDIGLDDYEQRLRPAAARRLPMLCANPDRVGLVDGVAVFGTGEVARLYERMGGLVHYVGKPFPAVFGAALAALTDGSGPGLPPHRICVVGDSLVHDIAGGRGAGCGTALVTAGIHARRYGGALPDAPDDADLEALVRSVGVTPDWALAAFRW